MTFSRNKFLTVKSKIISLHILAILGFILWDYSLVAYLSNAIPWWVFAVYYAVDLAFFYFLVLCFMPILFRKYNSASVLFFFSPIAFCLYVLFALIAATGLTYLYEERWNFKYNSVQILQLFSRSALFFILAFIYWYVKHSIGKAKTLAETEILYARSREREALMENALLRAQINPHFLFNALNSIYIRMLKKVPEDAGIVLLLAEMMDYSLVNTKEKAITTIGEELQHLERLFKLYQFLNNDSLQIMYDFNVSEQAKDIPIIPLLFFNLIENIFKHGKLDDPLQPALVKLVCHNNGIEFTSSNIKSNNGEGASRNIGLSNTRNRLQLHYPDNHELSILETEDRFEVRLIISL